MGGSVAGLAVRERHFEKDTGVDFALIGHQESWRAVSDVLAVLRGTEHSPLPDDEIKDILPWIPPRHPFPDVVHGCLLEGMALALEGRFESFSRGRGFITPQRVEEIETIAARHGIYLAPLYNADGPLPPISSSYPWRF